jgi:putative ABC transport system permease protein
VIISEKTAKLLGVGVGDTVTIQNEDEGNRDVVISQICENYMGHYIYMTPAYYESVFGEAPVYNCVLFAVQDSYDDEQMEEAGTRIMDRDEVLSISYMHDIQKQLDDMLTSLNLVIVVLIISAGMLAFVVLYNLNTINITERQRELATLKVLGFYDPEVATYVFRENIMLTFLGAAVGVVFGKVLTLFIIETVEVDAAMFGREINLSSFVYSLLFTIAFSLIINGIMYFKLKKIDMVESLKSIE